MVQRGRYTPQVHPVPAGTPATRVDHRDGLGARATTSMITPTFIVAGSTTTNIEQSNQNHETPEGIAVSEKA